MKSGDRAVDHSANSLLISNCAAKAESRNNMPIAKGSDVQRSGLGGCADRRGVLFGEAQITPLEMRNEYMHPVCETGHVPM